jgi:outer membrane assembly lipoprotein YfiO
MSQKTEVRMNKRALITSLCGIIILVALFGGCGKNVKKPEEMGFAELKGQALACIDKKKDENAIVYLERLVSEYPENQDIFEYKFMLADLYLKVGRLDAAYKLYKNYARLYPSESRAEESHYKSILSKFYQTLKISKDCDDSDTHTTLKQCKAYLTNTLFHKYRDDVRDIQYTCERRLIDKEVYVFNTYLRRKKFQSAQNRIEYLRNNFLEKIPTLEAQILYLESKLAYKKKDQGVVKQKIETLFEKYPESRFTKMAHSMVSSKRTFRF